MTGTRETMTRSTEQAMIDSTKKAAPSAANDRSSAAADKAAAADAAATAALPGRPPETLGTTEAAGSGTPESPSGLGGAPRQAPPATGISPAEEAAKPKPHAAKDLNRSARPLALVTGASSGIGYELARQCALNGYDLLIVADDDAIERAARDLQSLGGSVECLVADLATVDGVKKLLDAAASRPIDALLANAGHGLGKAFVDQEWDDIRHVVDTNVTGTLYLLHRVAREMRSRGRGRILITGSIAGFMPGTYQAVYNGTKAFVDMFAYALRAELQGCGVTVTCLMPGATDTDFFERADMKDTKVGTEKKDDPADVAEAGFKAMEAGDSGVVTGWQNKLMVALSGVMPETLLARQHAGMARPGGGK